MQSQDLLRDVATLLTGAERYLSESLHNENLSSSAKEQRDEILQSIHQIQNRYPFEFLQRGNEGTSISLGNEGLDESHNKSCGQSLTSDDVSLTSDNQDEDSEDRQDPEKILKQGYLEKRNRDHSFFGTEWQKRWCVLTKRTFCYYSSEKGKHPKGGVLIGDYSARLGPHIRKDSKRDSCFELVSPQRRSYQFTAASPVEAKEWVEHILFLERDIMSPTIPFEDDEEPYDDIDSPNSSPLLPRHLVPQVASSPQGDDIYEELPEEETDKTFEDLEGADCQIASGGVMYNYDSYYQGLWNCKSDNDDELSFERGDLIHILSKEYNAYGWWVGEMDGIVGIVPKDYLIAAFDLGGI